MHVDVNMDKINEFGLGVIANAVDAKAARLCKHEIMAVKLPSGAVLIATPISSINPLAAPDFEIRGKPKYCETNKSGHRRIVNVLRPACKSKHLPEAVKMLQAAINAISK